MIERSPGDPNRRTDEAVTAQVSPFTRLAAIQAATGRKLLGGKGWGYGISPPARFTAATIALVTAW